MATIIAPGLYQTSNGSYSRSSSGPGSSGTGTGGSSTKITTNSSNNNLSGMSYKTYATPEEAYTNAASNTAGLASTLPNEYGDLIRQALSTAENNTAQSQAFAREQMEYQSKSDATAMAWSAQEAEKNRQWQEQLSNTAHQREVEDLVKAGLNPILSANNGAYTGSGATGQGFSSSGAQGTVDTSASGILGNLVNTMINTASQAAIAGIYTDAQKYSSDLNYAASMSGIEAGIANTQMSANAQMASANAAAAASRYGSDVNERNNIRTNNQSYQNQIIASQTQKKVAEINKEASQYKTDYGNMFTNPLGYIFGASKSFDQLLNNDYSSSKYQYQPEY